MKTAFFFRAYRAHAAVALAALFVTVLLAWRAGAAPAAAPGKDKATAAAEPAAPVPFEPPKSVFIWDPADPGFGRDPFFPHSPRNGRWAPPPPKKEVKPVEPPGTTTPPPKPTETETPPQPPRREYKLDLSGIGGRRTAVINNISFLKGETGRVNTPQGPVKIRLDEILGDGVRVTIWLEDGKTEQREIPLSGR